MQKKCTQAQGEQENQQLKKKSQQWKHSLAAIAALNPPQQQSFSWWEEHHRLPATLHTQGRDLLQALITQSFPEFKVWNKADSPKQVKNSMQSISQSSHPSMSLVKDIAFHTYTRRLNMMS